MNKTLVIFAHPYFEHSRLNVQLIKAYQNIEHITFRDLYEEYPDFNIAAFRERKRLMVYDTLIFHFPMIWFGMPPLLKLWIDEVFDMKWVSEHIASPIDGKKAYIVLTTGGSSTAFSPQGIYKIPAEDYINTLIQSLHINNISVQQIISIYNAHTSTESEIDHYYQKIKNLVLNS
ncbi:flavodoxin family protein [Elizabethkingia argentiflava]|uniref:Flavodoxin family protein n=1 Tax=Elizabethkingia argenteiflava TaxID=2681556 RepID=A0A845PVY6_9FLAO|nr:NAD(P)H-dependent oxidoreductase [Elizabethkingia argenteiflava]NAW51805.1 flavodoxin family protein [Elizabethkingia argenteiflava]